MGASGIEDEKVKSTVKWAIGLGYDQSKTNFIIGRALAKKGINPTDYKDMITS